MRRTVLIIALALLCVPVIQAQEARIFQVEHADVRALADLLSVIDPRIQPNEQMRTLAVRGTPEALAAIEEAIARFDVPREPEKNVTLTFYMLLASSEAASPEVLPAELEDVARQLKSLFAYGGLHLMDTSVLRIRDGVGGNVGGAASYPGVPDDPPGTREDHPASYGLDVRQMDVSSGEDATVVRLDRLRLSFRAPYFDSDAPRTNEAGVRQTQWRSRAIELSTNIDIREGQKVVVGKASLDAQGNHLILVVTADVVD